ncbi:hypothetical protein VTN02DRAFT_1871 [Thermoascus thermophilus]
MLGREDAQPCGPAEARSTRTVGAVPLPHFPSIHRGRARTGTWGRPDCLIGLVVSVRPSPSLVRISLDDRRVVLLPPRSLSFWSPAFRRQTPLRAVVGMPRPVLHLRSFDCAHDHPPTTSGCDRSPRQPDHSLPFPPLDSSDVVDLLGPESVPIDSARVLR